MPDPEAYQIEISPAADRDLQKLCAYIRRQEFDRLAAAIDKLAHEPRPHGIRKIKGAVTAYRIRVGHYRAVSRLITPLTLTSSPPTIYA